MKDYYKILELTMQATQNDIKRSYRRLALLYHPDKNFGDKAAENKFKEIKEAYEILFNPEKRRSYDHSCRTFQQPGGKQKSSYSGSSARPITPSDMLVVLQNARRSAYATQFNQHILFSRLNIIFDRRAVSFLLVSGNTAINKYIIEEMMMSLKVMSYPYVEKIIPRLVQLAGPDKNLISLLYQLAQKRKSKYYLDKYKPVVAIISVILIFSFAVIVSERSAQENLQNIPSSQYISQVTGYTGKLDNPFSAQHFVNKGNGNSSGYRTGATPACFTFHPKYAPELDNNLTITAGSDADAVVKMVNESNDECVRCAYILQGESFPMKNIPEGKYYLQIASGSDWRDSSLNDKCAGGFKSHALYKRYPQTLDFNRRYAGKSFTLPSYTLYLQVFRPLAAGDTIPGQISQSAFMKE